MPKKVPVPVLVFAGLWQAGAELEKDGEIVAAHHPIPVRVDLEPPAEAVHMQRRRVDRVSLGLQPRDLRHREGLLVILRHDLRLEVWLHLGKNDQDDLKNNKHLSFTV